MAAKKKEIEVQDEMAMKDEVNMEKNIDSENESKLYLEKLNKDLEEQKQRADEYYDSLKRNMADFDNFKKRINKEKDSLYVSILCDIFQGLLPIVDNFDKAIEVESKDEKYKKGMEMIYKDIEDLLKKHGVEKIPDLGETFDPEYHEAVMSVEDDTKGEKEIIEVFRTGYKIGDKVVRHSLVKVAN